VGLNDRLNKFFLSCEEELWKGRGRIAPANSLLKLKHHLLPLLAGLHTNFKVK